MSDSKKAPPKVSNISSANTRLSNSLRLKAPNQAKRRQNMASILQRLPFLRQLTDTQNSLLKINPTWQRWCEQHSSVTLILSDNASLASLDQGILGIACNNASTASLVKNLQSSLLDAFQAAGFKHITRIKAQMALDTQNIGDADSDLTPPKSQQTAGVSKQTEASKKIRQKPSESALKSIEATQSLIENEQLAASLKRLAETLKR